MEVVAKLYDLNKDIDTKKIYCDPRRYLGAYVGSFDLPVGKGTEWFMPRYDYAKEAVNAVSTNII